MAAYNESIIRGGYVPFSLKKDYNLDVLGRTYDKLDEKSQKALEQASAIDLALSKIELNASEDSWKTNYINQIRKQIDSAAQFGNYATALSTATKLAGKALSDPALLGRVRANANYEEAKKQILNRNDINQVTKDRWLEQNPYSYQDKYDNLGNVIGGTDWNPNWRPVSRYDMSQLYGLVKQLAAEEAGGGESAQFLDKNDNLTSDPSKGFYGMAIKRGSEWHRLSEDKLRRVFNSLFKQAPEAMDALLQDMDDRHWQYEKADDEGKKEFIGSDIMDDSGRMYSPQEYLEHRVNPVLHEMAYNRVKSSVDFGNAWAQKITDDRKKAANNLILANDRANRAQALTMPLELSLADVATTSYANVNDAIKALSGMVSDSIIKTAVTSGDYNIIAKQAEFIASKLKLNDKLKQNLLSNAAIIRKEAERLYKLTDGFTKEEKDAFFINSAIQLGIPVSTASTNIYGKRYGDNINRLFSYDDKAGKRHYVDDVNLTFNNISDLNSVKQSLNLSDDDLEKKGVYQEIINGLPSLRINKNSPLLRTVATVADKYKLEYKDINGNIVDDYYTGVNRAANVPVGTPWGITNESAKLSPYDIVANNNSNKLKLLSENSVLERDLDNIIKRAFARTNKTSTVPIEMNPADDATTLMLDEMLRNNLIEDARYKDEYKKNMDNNLNQVGYAMSHPGNLSIYAPDEFGGVGYKLEISDDRVKEIAREVLGAISDNRAKIGFTSQPTPAGYGTVIRIEPKIDSKGNALTEPKIYYFDGLLKSAAAEAIANDPDKFMRGEFIKDRGIGTNIVDVDGNIINYNSPNAYNRYKLKNDIEDVKQQVRQSISDGNPVTEKEILAALTNVFVSAGVNLNSEYGKTTFQKIYSELMAM